MSLKIMSFDLLEKHEHHKPYIIFYKNYSDFFVFLLTFIVLSSALIE